jgi:tight adherence protein B
VTLLAVTATGVFAYLLVGVLTGNAPELRLGRSKPKVQVSASQLWLVQAGVNLTPRQFWSASVALALATFTIVVLVTATPSVAVVPGCAMGLLPRLYFARQRSRRMRSVQEAWPDALREIVGGINAGMSLPQAVSALARSGPESIREAFSRFPLLMRMLGVVPALEVIKEELADPTSDRVIEVLILAQERGGRIVSDVLRDLGDATNEDVKTTEEIATNALEQKINARAVFVLPWMVLLLLTAKPGHFRDFYQSPAGLLVVLIAAAASLIGMAVLGRLSKDPVEERVLGAAATVDDGGAAR